MFWSGERLRTELPSLMKPYKESRIDCASYTLSVGREIYVTPDHNIPNRSAHTKSRLDESEAFTIPSGQFAFLMTEEFVHVPSYAIAFISMKAKTKFKGLINVSGFHVDPGFHGRLVFSVYNAGPQAVHLQRCQPLFLIWYADLDRHSKYVKKSYMTPKELDNELIMDVSGTVLSLQSLNEKLLAYEREITDKIHKTDITVTKISIITTTIFSLLITLVIYFMKDEVKAFLLSQ